MVFPACGGFREGYSSDESPLPQALLGAIFLLSAGQTHIVIFDVSKSGWSSADFLQALAKQNVLAVPVDDEKVRMVTHLDVDRGDVERAAANVDEVMKSSLL